MAKAQAQEPSMEEILASIRRIIADEDTGPAAATKIASVAAKSSPQKDVSVSEDELDKLFDANDDDDDVLDLGETDKADQTPDDDIDVDLTFEPISVSAPVKKTSPPRPEAARAEMPRVEPARAAAAEPQPEPSSFDRRRSVQEPKPAFSESSVDPLLSQATDSMVSAAFDNLALTILNKNARTVEDLIQDMLRPMLRSWLDQNLPALVERLVRAEIERVARGR